MKDLPILFKSPMVCAILEDRKLQTRRVPTRNNSFRDGIRATAERWNELDWQSPEIFVDDGPSPAGNPGPYLHVPDKDGDCSHRIYPQWRRGDRLWVRETWTWNGGSLSYPRDTPLPAGAYDKLYVSYAADGCARTIETGGKVLPVPRQPPRRDGEEYCRRDAPADFVYTGDNTYVDRLGRWWKRKIPAIHMPRWASRILLEITDVRVQRVQGISAADARAEGIDLNFHDSWAPSNQIRAFARLWDSINEKRGYGWNANPWTWALTFKRVTETAA